MSTFTRTFGILALLSLQSLEVCLAYFSDSQDPLAPFNNDKPPRIVTTLKTFRTDGVEVTRFRFESRPIPTSNGVEQVEIFASLCRPVSAHDRLPAILVLHGGGGKAEESRAIGWAKLGYVALAPDLPAIGEPQKLQSLGPFRREKYSADHFRVINGDASTCGMFDAVVSGLKSLALLRSQPDVDRQHVGIVGVSWGGYMATMLSGLAGDRVHAAFSVFGCGYFDRGSAPCNILQDKSNLATMDPAGREAWLRWLDAGRRAKGIRCPIFFAAATNDFFFFPPAMMATYDDIIAPKNLVFAPNISHGINLPGGMHGWNNDTWVDMEVPWFDLYLRGNGEPFPTMTPTGAKREENGIRVSFAVTRPATTTVYYTSDDTPWTKKKWLLLATEKESALIPVENPDKPIYWYGLASDVRPVTVSTTIQALDPLTLGFSSAVSSSTPGTTTQ